MRRIYLVLIAVLIAIGFAVIYLPNAKVGALSQSAVVGVPYASNLSLQEISTIDNNITVRLTSPQLDSNNFDTIAVLWGDKNITFVHVINGTITVSYPYKSATYEAKEVNDSIYLSHIYRNAKASYNISAADLYGYSNNISVAVTTVIPEAGNYSEPTSDEFIMIPYEGSGGSIRFEYIPIETSNLTLATFICIYAPVAIQDPYTGSEAANFSSDYSLQGQIEYANLGNSLVAANQSNYNFEPAEMEGTEC